MGDSERGLSHACRRRLPAAVSFVFALVLFSASLPGARVRAHGDWGHVHVTAWAIENLPEGELREFFREPEVYAAALFGAAFPDAGYFVAGGDDTVASREFAEHTHWEPFIQDFVELIRRDHAPPFDDLEARKLVAFMMGCAAHGLQDEIFDSLFLFQTAEHDGAGQSDVDPASDGFLFADMHFRVVPDTYVPVEPLVELYAGLPVDITEDIVSGAVMVLTGFYINDEVGPAVARAAADIYGSDLPWTEAHYMDPDVPGSLISEIEPTMHYIEALWDRVHDRWTPEDLVIHAYPDASSRLRSHVAGTTDSWVTLVFGLGLETGNAGGTFVDDDGADVPFQFLYTRWGNPLSRLVRFLPDGDLTPGAFYTVGLDADAPLVDGSSSVANSATFQVACDQPDPILCPDLQREVPVIDGSTWSFSMGGAGGQGGAAGSGGAGGATDGPAAMGGDAGGCSVQVTSQADVSLAMLGLLVTLCVGARSRLRVVPPL